MNSLSLPASKTKSKKVLTNTFWTVQKKALTIKLTAVSLVVGILAVGSWQISEFYANKILPKVMVAGVKVGGKTPAEAKTMINDYISKINSEGPEIKYTDQTIKPKLDELGLTFNVDQIVDEAYGFGRTGSFKERVQDNSKMIIKNYNVSLNPQIDEKKFDEQLGKIAQVVEVAPQNATLTITNGNISLAPSKIGRGLDKTKLKNDLAQLIDKEKLNSQITLVTSDLQPTILEKDTIAAQNQANKFMTAAPIQVTFEDQTFTADKAEVGKWIEFKEDGSKLTAALSTGKIAVFAGGIASKIEIDMVNREVMDGTGQVLNEGQDGRGVDTKQLTNDLYARVLASSTVSIGVATYPIPKGLVTTNPHAQPGRYPGRYIDINLSEQTLYAFEGMNLVNQFLISGGKTGATPTGEFHVYNKTRSQTMDGPGYSLPHVEWISWFSGDYSIHGTYWHNNFGQPMSHGCVNASNGNAEWIYNWDEVGTPVYIHR